MSIYHLTVKMHSRAKNKKLHALRALAYRTGSRIVDPATQHIYDSTSKSREVNRASKQVSMACASEQDSSFDAERASSEIRARRTWFGVYW